MVPHRLDGPAQRLVLVTGWTAAGKSTIADAIAAESGATVAGFDWLMSALRVQPDVWHVVSRPVERQRDTGWLLLSRVAEQQLRRGASCVVDGVARRPNRERLAQLAVTYGARFDVIECVCSSESLHRSRVIGRERNIPGWYELDWDHVQRFRNNYEPLADPKCVIDAVDDLTINLAIVREYLTRTRPDVDLVDFEPTDQQAVRDLVLDGLTEHWGALDESFNADLDDIAASYGAGRTVVLRRATGIIATGTLIRRDASTAEIVRMSVHRDHRHVGIGRRVVSELLDTARRWGMRRVVLETSSAWEEVVRFYRSCGFSPTGRTEGAFGEDTWFEMVLEPKPTAVAPV